TTPAPTPTVTVTQEAPPANPPANTPTNTVTKTTKPPNIVSFTKVKASSKGTLTLSISLPAPGTATVTATVSVKGHKVTYSGPVKVSAKTARTIIAVLKRSSTATKRLKHVRSATVSVSVTFTPTGGTRHTATLSVPVG